MLFLCMLQKKKKEPALLEGRVLCVTRHIGKYLWPYSHCILCISVTLKHGAECAAGGLC